jgi:hypothetical protein
MQVDVQILFDRRQAIDPNTIETVFDGLRIVHGVTLKSG